MAKPLQHVLFVCTGNVCRSPMAEALFRRAVQGRADLAAGSAGVSAMAGQHPSPDAIAVLRDEEGIDISNYRSRPLDEDLVDEATHIFTMTLDHLLVIQRRFPHAAEKTFLLREFEEGNLPREVPDPIGLGRDRYIECRDTIKAALPGLLSFIGQTASSSMTPENSTVRPLHIAVATDHGGVDLKKKLVAHLCGHGYAVRDFGSDSPDAVDYPDYAGPVCLEVSAGRADFGILLCKSGLGMSIAANRFPAIRAALVLDPADARLTRQHNDANVLCLAAEKVTDSAARKIVDAFLSTPFEGGRHAARVRKLGQLACGADHPALLAADPEVAEAVAAEGRRQSENIELIASENFASRAVMEAQGSCLTNKYAEGYPGKRWYGGCEHVDTVESLAIERAKRLFGAEHANVQPHSGSQANMAVYFSVLQPGDRILTMDLAHGGHLTHGNKANFSGRFFQVTHYGVNRETEQIDYDTLARQAEEARPKMITAGASAYPRIIDFKRLREIADAVGALLFVDMAHIAGLVATGAHPSPIPFADFVTTTTHKSLRGPRGGLIFCRAQFAKAVDSNIFPGVQGGPLMHVIAAKAVCLHEALQPGFKAYQQQVVSNAKALSVRLAMNGYRIVSGGTDNHLMLVDLRPKNITGKEAETVLDLAGITVNKNSIPFDTLPVTKSGGIRIGTPAVSTRGMKEEEMMEIADLIHRTLEGRADPATAAAVRQEVRALTAKFPLP